MMKEQEQERAIVISDAHPYERNYIQKYSNQNFHEHDEKEVTIAIERALNNVSWTTVETFIDDANQFVRDVEADGMLGSAIIRRCTEFADVIGGLANELEEQSKTDRRALAHACLVEIQQDFPGKDHVSDEEDMIHALVGAQDLLRDVESALRGIDQRDAEEIADVSITLAKLFLLSLKDIMKQFKQEQQQQEKDKDDMSPRIEIIDDGESNQENEINPTKGNIVVEQEKEATTSSTDNKDNNDRVRCLWPPIGPAVVQSCKWGKEQAMNKPLLAAALGLTLWPAAIVTALCGAPLVAADGLIQHVYNSMSNGPLVETLERGAAQVVQATKLSVLCGGLAARQSMRVVSRQVERQGGVGNVVQNIGGAILDRAVHPVETACMAWDGLVFGAGAVKDAVGTLYDGSIEKQEEIKKAESTI